MEKFKVIDRHGRSVNPPTPIHPGELLADEIEAMEITQREFAKLIDMKPPHLNELIKGKRNITAYIALKLEDILGVSASFWMRAQGDYYLEVNRLDQQGMKEISQEEFC